MRRLIILPALVLFPLAAPAQDTGPRAGTISRLAGSPHEPGTALEVFMNEQWRPARVLAEPAYDPQSLKPRTDVMEAAAE